MLNFISSDYDALEPFQESSAAVRILRAMYIVIITILFLNILIAMLNLKIKRADKNAQNLYYLQMASLQVEIELGLLSSAERARQDWFPTWFHYSMTKTEKRVWEHYVETNPLKWTEENNFGEDDDHVPQTLPKYPSTEVVDKAPIKSTGLDAMPAKSRTETADSPANTVGTSQADYEGPQDGINNTNAISNSEPIPTIPNDDENQSTHTNPTCKICGKPGKRCTNCSSVAYCGKEHQKQDWKNHKTACKGKQKADS